MDDRNEDGKHYDSTLLVEGDHFAKALYMVFRLTSPIVHLSMHCSGAMNLKNVFADAYDDKD